MRRPAPTMSISPKQLKHFAAATVAITGLLALFAGDESIGISTEIQAREARSQLIESETGKLGTKQLKANLKLKNGSRSQFSFSDGGNVVDTAGEWGGGGGDSVRAAPRKAAAPHNASASATVHNKLPKTPGQSVTIVGAEGVPDGAKPEENRAKKTPKKVVAKTPVTEPTQEDLDKAMESSRQRSGQAEPTQD